MIDVEQTIISQYQRSQTIVRLIKNMNEYIDPRKDIQGFFDAAFNIETAQGFGLDCLGKIAGVGRTIKIAAPYPMVGFKMASGAEAYMPMGFAGFFAGNATSNFVMGDDLYRFVVQAKMLSNIIETTAPAINQVLKNLFPDRGECYVIDRYDMSIRYIFKFDLTPVEAAIIALPGILPRPAGVDDGLSPLPPQAAFIGFFGQQPYATPMGYGVLYA